MTALGLGVSLSLAYVWVDLGSRYIACTFQSLVLYYMYFWTYPHSDISNDLTLLIV